MVRNRFTLARAMFFEASAHRSSLLAQAVRFDFTDKLRLFPEKVESVLRKDAARALSVVYLDVNTNICNHECVFCDGFYRPLKVASIPTQRLLNLVDEMEELGVLAVVMAGDRGEPMMHSGFPRLLERLAESPIQSGLYTNGALIPEKALEPLRRVAWLRVSADAGSAEVHRRMHVYPTRRHDFDRLLENLGTLSSLVPEIGVSFILDPINVHEIELAADVLLGAGARFIEYKPKYLPDYTVDTAWLQRNSEQIGKAIVAVKRNWDDRIIVNNQIPGLLDTLERPDLRRAPRQCLTSLLRMVISTHGCYPCTPYRGEGERRFGNILTQSLREVLATAERQSLLDNPCSRVCAYDAQNDFLLDLREHGARLPMPTLDPQPQDYFL